jgi:rod shape-determining protein MreD
LRLILVFGLFALVSLGIETALPHLIPVGAFLPNLIVILAVDLGLRHHGAIPALIAFAMGYATDALSGSHLGLNALFVTLAFVAAYEMSSRLMVTNAFVGAMLVMIATVVIALGSIALTAGIASLGDIGPLVPALATQAFLSAILTAPIFALLAGVKKAIGLPIAAARE